MRVLTKANGVFGTPGFRIRLREMSPASDRVWLAALLVGLSLTLVAAYLFPAWSSESGKFWAYAALLIRACLYAWAKDALRGRGGEVIWRLFTLGLIAGALEVLVDWALIRWVPNGKLIYLSGQDVVLLGSPVWMPMAWAGMITEIGYLALRLFGLLDRRLPTRLASIATSLAIGILASVLVGFYEFFAYRAGWWKYEPAVAMIGEFCALYIPLGEFFMFLTILPIAAAAIGDEERPVSATILGGARFGLAIAGGYALGYLLLEFGRTPHP